MDSKLYVDRILENENLTDELEDDDARVLLDWGIRQLERALAGIEEDNPASARCTALMAVMRKINGLVGGRSRISEEVYLRTISGLDASYAETMGQENFKAISVDTTTAKEFSQMPSRAALDYLLKRYSL